MNCAVLESLYASMTYGTVTIQGWINMLSSLPRPLLSWSHTQQLLIIPKGYPRQIQSSQIHTSVSRQCVKRPAKKKKKKPASRSACTGCKDSYNFVSCVYSPRRPHAASQPYLYPHNGFLCIYDLLHYVNYVMRQTSFSYESFQTFL